MIDVAEVPVPGGALQAEVAPPGAGQGLVVFAHGSGSSRASARNGYVAEVLHGAGMGTMLVDLLTPDEMRDDAVTERFRYDIALVSDRTCQAVQWVHAEGLVDHPRGIGVFGASTGAAAALRAAARHPGLVGAVVSRGGRADLASDALPGVIAPTLLIAGGNDRAIVGVAETALPYLGGIARMHVIPGASHLFEEPGAMDQVAVLARDWFIRYL